MIMKGSRMSARSIRCWHIGGWVLTGVSLLSSGGCAPTEGGPRASLYEVRHVQPDHWPADLDDLAKKLRARIAALDENPAQGTASRELTDLVGWAAEVAADTDLTEAQWLPIYEKTETLRRGLRSSRYAWTESNLERAAELAERVERAAGQLPGGGTVAWPVERPDETAEQTRPSGSPGPNEAEDQVSPAPAVGDASANGRGGDGS